MKPTTEILARISQNSLANKEEVFTKLYRYLLRPDIYFVADEKYLCQYNSPFSFAHICPVLPIFALYLRQHIILTESVKMYKTTQILADHGHR